MCILESILKYLTRLEEIAVDVLKNSWKWSKMKIWAKAVKIFNFRAQGVNESLRQYM